MFCICSLLGILLFQVLHLGFTLFWAYFVYGIRKCFKVIILQVAVQFSQHHLLKRLSFLRGHQHFSEQAYVLEHLWSFYRIYSCINWFCSNTQRLGAPVHFLRSNGSLQSFSSHSLLLISITKSVKLPCLVWVTTFAWTPGTASLDLCLFSLSVHWPSIVMVA